MATANNFRRDLAGKVYRLSQYTNLDPVVDKDFSTLKMNERFIKMHEAVKTCFEAIADVASRDSSFLPSFFQGTVNPVYVKTFSYEKKDAYLFVNGFSTNGTPLSFSEPRIMYSYSEVGDVSTNDYNCLLFKNGKLMPFSQYDLENTAYGLKAFVKASFVNDNDEVTLAVHRVYNRNYSSWRKNFTIDTNTVDEVIDCSINFPNFYNIVYIKACIRRSGKVHFEPLPSAFYTLSQDDSGTKIRFYSDKIPFKNGDTLLIYDTTTYFEKYIESSYNSSTNVVTDPVYKVDGDSVITVDLVHEIPTVINGVFERVPVGTFSENDFDVWLDGYKLLPTKHYRVIPYDINLDKPAKIVVNIDKYPSNVYTNAQRKGVLYISKNLPCIKGKTTILNKDLSDEKGVEFLNEYFIPSISNIGEIYSNGLLVDTKNAKSQSKDIVTFDLTKRNDFFYRLNAPMVQSTTDLLEEAKNKYTEVDRMITITGGTEALIQRLKEVRPLLPTVTEDTVYLITEGQGLINDTYGEILQILLGYVNQYIAASDGLTIDSNSTNSILTELIDDSLDINSNVELDREIIIDANASEIVIGV